MPPGDAGLRSCLRDEDILDVRAPRLPPAGDRERSRRRRWLLRTARATGDFDAAIRDGLTTILASPKFLFRAERLPANAAPGAIYRISDLDLASRLSFFLPARVPDDQLLDVAEKGRLADHEGARGAGPRACWPRPRRSRWSPTLPSSGCDVRGTRQIDPDAVVFPNFDDSLRDAFRKEIELFVGSILREDRSVLDLLTADDTFVNERLALHYGIPNVRGERFRRVTLTDPNRWGLLGQGQRADGDLVRRTAPRRCCAAPGSWRTSSARRRRAAARRRGRSRRTRKARRRRSVREIMEQHRSKPSCNACHGVMDPLGFALENFDAIGEWRAKDRYAGTVIDASGKLVDGTAVNSPADLRTALMKRPEIFAQIGARLPATLELALCAMIAAVLISFPLATVAAVRRGGWIDRLALLFSLLGLSMPNFWLGPLLMIIFSIQLGWPPVSGRGGLSHLVLPALTLGLGMAAILIRILRASLLRAMTRTTFRPLAPKVCASASLVKTYVAQRAASVVTIMSLQFGSLLAGSLITETIFSWPGLGRLTVQAIQTRDYPLVQGCVLVIAVSYILVNFFTDLVYKSSIHGSPMASSGWFYAGAAILLLLAAAALFAPALAPYDPFSQNLDQDLLALPSTSARHGQAGRDILSRMIYGGRISLLVGVTTVALSLAIGVVHRLSFRLFRRLDRSHAHAPCRYFDGVSRAFFSPSRLPPSWVLVSITSFSRFV